MLYIDIYVSKLAIAIYSKFIHKRAHYLCTPKKKILVVASSFIFENDRCQEDLTLVKTAVMNPTKSKDFKLTQSTEEVVERINALHGYEINITSVQPNTDRCFRSIQIYHKNISVCIYIVIDIDIVCTCIY